MHHVSYLLVDSRQLILGCLSSSTCTSISCSSLQHTMSSKTLPADIPKFGEIRPWLHRLAKEGLIVIKDVAILAEPAPPELSHGAMTDAPKRAKPDHAEWVFPSQAACAAASGGDIKKDGYTARSLSPELPPGVTSLEQWGSTVCTLPKIKDRNLCYTEILASKENMILDYVTWIYNNRSKSAKAEDFAKYMDAVKWDKPSQPAIPGTKESRVFK